MVNANISGSDVLLEVLGNESRRKILSLLSKKPCYVSEISYLLKMAPKAVLEHLDKLEKAGLIKSFEDGRRRYYRIDKSMRIEITITPHMFETRILIEGRRKDDALKTEDAMDKARDIITNVKDVGMPELRDTLRQIGQVQNRISEIQGMINSRVTEMFDKIIGEIDRCIKDEIEKITLIGIAKGANTSFEISEQFGIPYKDVEKALQRLQERGLVKPAKRGDETVWVLCGIPE